MSFVIYKKQIRKSWLVAVLPGVGLAVFIALFAVAFPEFKSQAADLQDLMQSSFYQLILGSYAQNQMDTWSGFYSLEVFMFLEIAVIFMAVFLGGGIITREVDKQTFDMILSLPIPRWKLILTKFMVYQTIGAGVLAIMFIATFGFTVAIGESFNFAGLVLTLMGFWILYLAMGAIALLLATVVLSSKTTYALGGGAFIGMWIVERIVGMAESLQSLQNISLFHYVDPTEMIQNNATPVIDFLVLLLVGLVALVLALLLVERRDLTY